MEYKNIRPIDYKYVLDPKTFIQLDQKLKIAKMLGYNFITHNGTIYDINGQDTGIPDV